MTDVPTIGPADAEVIAASLSRQDGAGVGVRRLLTGAAFPAGALALTLIALLTPGTVSDLQRVGAALLFAVAISAAVLARSAERTPQWQVAAGSLAGSAAFACYRLATQTADGARADAMAACTTAILITIAISVHLILALPDGRLTRPPVPVRGPARRGRPVQPSRPRRIVAILAYAAAVAAGLALGVQHIVVSVQIGAAVSAAAVVLALPSVRLEYQAAAGRNRERLQWVSAGAVLAAGLALAAAVLHMLVGWPAPVAATVAACLAALPLGMIAGEIRPLGPSGGRVLVQVIAVAGFTGLVSVVYVIIVLGVSSGPTDASDRELLGFSMLAAAIAAMGYLPARERLLGWAKHAVYGAREAPDEALRTFGSRDRKSVV